jgi:hypothetical protein
MLLAGLDMITAPSRRRVLQRAGVVPQDKRQDGDQQINFGDVFIRSNAV